MEKAKAKNNNVAKTAELGMPIGTASNRLRKMVLFRLLQRLGEDVCFQCARKIERVEDLSVEHKVAWLHNDPALFWNLDNVAFSHLTCNVNAADKSIARSNGGKGNRKIGSNGTAWCISHQDFLPVAEFFKQQSNWNGLDQYCRECRSIRR